MKLYISEPEQRESGPILIYDDAHNDIAEFFHNEHATVGQSYETALALAQKLVTCGVAQGPFESREDLAKVIAYELEDGSFHGARVTGPHLDNYHIYGHVNLLALAGAILRRAQPPAAPVETGCTSSDGGGESRPASTEPQASASRRPQGLIGEAGVAPSPSDPQCSAGTECDFERDGIARCLFNKAMSGHAQWDEMTEPNKEDWRVRADAWILDVTSLIEMSRSLRCLKR